MADLLRQGSLSLMLTPMNLVRVVAWSLVNRWVQRTFPDVPTVPPAGLADWLSQNSGPAPILLDGRRDDEFAVSHLPGAYSAPNIETALALDLERDRPIVVYCSVGYRSARLAAQLQAAGYSQVYNLLGSAFQWANQGRSLVSQAQPVATVHPFNPVWGLLLKPGRAHRLDD
ncbi:rhodanese-like domain-containing protein [Nodosilinea sp. E11]|uniref:rhodanese-like domain-containing protein n=1 Tax=Nodosilinea sp. E11 TaxID=3037479 RepID=UPI002934A281|nr:rhodanese-like domain-containing protein [Nodosilinea sp. E11]WOD39410.1 rhodanese-like domain-containing protein [Nodosilinea sp. E11]